MVKTRDKMMVDKGSRLPMEQLSLDFSRHSALLSPDEIYHRADQQLLSKLDEDRRLERKPPGIHGKELGEYFSMWSNTIDGGLIVVGMENKGVFAGCHGLSSGQLNAIEKSAYTYCPEAHFDSKRIGITSTDGVASFVVLFRVEYHEDRVVKTSSGEAFCRRGDEKHRLTDGEIHELEIDKRQIDIEKETVSLNYPEDFDIDLIRKFIESVRKMHNAVQDHRDIEVLQCRRLGIIRDNVFIPNTTCALVFARDPQQLFPGCEVRFMRFDGETEKSGSNYNVVKRISIESLPLPRLIAESAEAIKSQLREFSRLGQDGKFYTAPEYPREAWYEALINACVHRSYGLKNMNIFIKMFDDKLVIESPGGFPPLVTPENIYTTHHPRNPTLMRTLFYMDLVREHAEGTKRMRDTMVSENLPPPEFKQIQTSMGFAQVVVTLRGNQKQRSVWVDSDVSIRLGEALTKNLTAEEKRILNFVAENGKINVVQCHRLIPNLAKWHSAKKLLLKMVDKGFLKYIHSPSVKRDAHAHFVLPEVFKQRGNSETEKIRK